MTDLRFGRRSLIEKNSFKYGGEEGGWYSCKVEEEYNVKVLKNNSNGWDMVGN